LIDGTTIIPGNLVLLNVILNIGETLLPKDMEYD
jgi:hypothetical protein